MEEVVSYFTKNPSPIPPNPASILRGRRKHGPNGAPNSLILTVISPTSIRLNWTAGSTNEDGFSIERSSDNSTWVEILTTLAGVVTVTNTGLTQGGLYYYRVRSKKGNVYSNYSNTVNNYAAPSNLIATAISSTRIDLSWTDNSNSETGFAIERSTNGVDFTEIITVLAGVTTYSDTGLDIFTTYYYRVRCFFVDDMPLDGNPSALNVTVISSTQLNLSWTIGSTNHVGHKIERSTDNATWSEIASVTGSTNTYSNTGLTEASQYYYRVRAYNILYFSSYSASANNTTIPTAPTALSVTPNTETQIDLAWTVNSTHRDGHRIYISTDNITFTEKGTVSGSTAVYSATALTQATRYYFKVVAYKNTTESDATSVVDDYTYFAFALASTGNGTAVTTLRFTSSVTQTIKLTDVARFYTNIGGSTGESTTWSCASGASRTIYLKCTSGTAKLLVHIRHITAWGDVAVGPGWSGAANSPSITANIESFPAATMTQFYVLTIATLSGSINGFSALTCLIGSAFINGSITGGVTGKTTLQYLSVAAALTGSLAGLTELLSLNINTTNNYSGSLTNLTKMQGFYINGSGGVTGDLSGWNSLGSVDIIANTVLTGDISGSTGLTRFYVSGASPVTCSLTNKTSLTYLYTTSYRNASGNLGSSNMVNGILTLYMTACGQFSYTAGASWSNASVTITPYAGQGMTSTEIDNILIDMAASTGLISKTIDLRGSNAARTAASNAAVATLTGAGRTNTVYTN